MLVRSGPSFDFANELRSTVRGLEVQSPLKKFEAFAQARNREVFVASDQGQVRAIGTLTSHRVVAVNGNFVEFAASHARHEVVVPHTLQVGRSYEVAIDPASNEVLLFRDAVAGRDLGTVALTSPPVALTPISAEKAREIFDVVKRQPHIPFEYPANGCWARAHEMCRLIEKHLDNHATDIVCKTWIYGNLAVASSNTPKCKVRWGWHVAPLVHVDGKDVVLDPSMFGEPVQEAKWRQAQGDPNAKRAVTSRAVFYRNAQGVESSEAPNETESDMQDQRELLFAQIYAHGPLPYEC